jgi:hypothetical protein
MTIPYELLEETNLGTVMRGDTIPLPVWVAKDYEGLTIDLTGATIWATFKTSLDLDDDDPGAFQQSTLSTGVEIIEPLFGGYQVTIESNKTASLTDETAFFFDVQVRTAEGQTTTVKRGTITFAADVTRTIA